MCAAQHLLRALQQRAALPQRLAQVIIFALQFRVRIVPHRTTSEKRAP